MFSCARHDHGLLISSKKAPTERIHTISYLEETLTNKQTTLLHGQQFATRTKNQFNGNSLLSFDFQYLPKWNYLVSGIEIEKEVVLLQKENTLAIRYKVHCFKPNNQLLNVTPLFRLTKKDEYPNNKNNIMFTDSSCTNTITNNTCFYSTNGKVNIHDTEKVGDLFFEYDARDGRDCIGKSIKGVVFQFEITKEYEEFYILFSDTSYPQNTNLKTIQNMYDEEVIRQKQLITTSGLLHPIAQSLVLASDKFITHRDSTNTKTILAGYPWFLDWGRDTMIAILGCVISCKRFEDAKSILRTFKSYEKQGMMPNMFPDNPLEKPLYNTVDASLLFIDAVYQLYQANLDLEFVEELFTTMEHIIFHYRKGTDFHIKMDEDGLIMAGDELEQLTWMDIRFDDILPTPRHGKPVEINAYWYNALCIMDYFSHLLQKDRSDYKILAETKVKPSFLKQFWSEELGCLKDVISRTHADMQIRSNQVWALSMPFTMIETNMAEKILHMIFTKLYTPYGLRSLDQLDPEFKPTYGGSHFNRDMAYHQGTVWPFPLGAYYLAVLRYGSICGHSNKALLEVKRQLEYTATTLYEGCLGQIAEVFDGENPTNSQGCFAQAWSVGEILRVYEAIEIF